MQTKRNKLTLTLVGCGDGALPTASAERRRIGSASIAVLPFANMGEAGDDCLCAGVSEDVITELSRFRALQVIGAGSSFACQPFATDTRRVARELGCRYVLEGSIRRTGQRLCITTHLLDGVTGELIASDRHDGSLVDMLAVQEDIARHIAGRIEPELVTAEINRALQVPLTDLDAYEMVLRGRALLRRGSETDDVALINEGLTLVRQAAAQDPSSAEAHRILAWGFCLRGELGFFGPDSQADYVAAAAAAMQARALNPRSHTGYAIYGHVAMRRLRHDEALASLRHAHELNPNAVVTLRWLAWEEANHGLAAEAREHSDLSLRLSPRDHSIAHGYWVRALADYVAGDLATCAEGVQRATALTRHTGYRLLLAACLAEMERLTEARAVMEDVARNCPGFVESQLAGNTYFARVELHERYVAALRRAAGTVAAPTPDRDAAPAPEASLPTAATLTKRELQVLRLVARGKSNAALADVLGISEFTAKRHVSNILTKLDLPTRGAAAAFAARHGLG